MLTWILSDHPSLNQRLRQLVTQWGHACPTDNVLRLEAAAQVSGLTSPEPQLVLIVWSPQADRGLAAIRQLRLIAMNTVIVVGSRDPAQILDAVRAGAHDYVDDSDRLEYELQAALQRQTAHQGSVTHAHGRLIAVTGACGGSGRSVAAVNLSVLFANALSRSCLIDLDPGGGACASMLNLTGRHNILDLGQFPEKLDRTTLEQSLVVHESGVSLLPGAGEIVPPGLFDSGFIDRLVCGARSLFPAVVLDLHNLADEVLFRRLLGHDVKLAILTRLDFNSVCSTGRTLDYWDRCGLPRKNVVLVANRRGQPGEIPLKKVEQALSLRIQHFLPDDAAIVNRSINNGLPIVLAEPHSPLGKAFAELSMALLGDAAVRAAAPDRPKDSFFSRHRIASMLRLG